MVGMSRVAYTLHNALTSWQFGPFQLMVLAAVLAAAAWYLQADWKLASRGRHWSGKRTAAFLSGLLAIDLALQSPIATFTAGYFQAHILQHLLLMVVGPPLLALGAPSTLLLQTSSRTTKQRWLRFLNSKPFVIISHPIPVWALYYGAMYMFFLTSLVGYAMNHMALMDAINVGFLAGATLFWWPTIGVDPIPHWHMGYGARMLNLFIGVPVETWLGVALMNESLSQVRSDAPMYTLASVHTGGSLLWMFSEIASAGAILPIFVQWMRSEERKGARADAALDRREAEVTAAVVPEPYLDLDGVMSRWEASLFASIEPPWIAPPGPANDEVRADPAGAAGS
jgi:putative copper resistance protein D